MTRSNASACAALLTAQLACCPTDAGAQITDQVIVTLGAHELPGAGGDRVAVDLVHREADRILQAGIERRRAGPTDWRLLELAGVLVRRRFDVGVGIEAGPDSASRSRGNYVNLRMQLGLRPQDRWSFGVENSYIDVDPVEGFLGAVAATRHRAGGSSIGLKLAGSHGGNLDEQSLSLRYDKRTRLPHFFAGISVGVTNNRLLLDLPAEQATRTRVRQAFAGISTLLANSTASVMLEVADLDGLRRVGVTVVVAHGLGQGGQSP